MTEKREADFDLDMLLHHASSTLEKHLGYVVDPDTMFSAVMNTAARHEAGDLRPERRTATEVEVAEGSRPAPSAIQNKRGVPEGSTISRALLGSLLRRLRQSREISVDEAAYHLRASNSKINYMESGRTRIKERDVADLLTLYGVIADDERARVLELASRSGELGWWHAYSDLMPTWFEGYVALEESSSRIKSYEIQFVPGLLQTEDYALAIASRGHPDNATRDAERKVHLRMQRQKILLGNNAPKLWAIIDESVLHRQFGGKRVLREQINRLLEMTKLPNISLQVVPYQASGYGAEGPFTLLRFTEPELSDVVYVEHFSGALYLERPEEIEVYSRAFDRLAVEAETPARSRQLLLRARDGT